MVIKCSQCPIKGDCQSYPALCRRHTDDPARWRKVVEQVNGLSAPEYPSFATQAANLAGSAARFVASGGATVDQAEFARRRAICLACPTKRYDADQDRCRACGCFASIKPWGKAESCPDGHW